MNKTSFLRFILIAAIIAGGSYVYGVQAGANKAKSEAQSELKAVKADSEELSESAQQAWTTYGDLSADYEELSNNYDKLYNAAKVYVATPRYTPRQPVTCNSYSYSMNSVSTTCY